MVNTPSNLALAYPGIFFKHRFRLRTMRSKNPLVHEAFAVLKLHLIPSKVMSSFTSFLVNALPSSDKTCFCAPY